MAIVALASLKGSPWVTTTALVLTAVWPRHRPSVLAELDPSGGDLAARHQIGLEPGVVSLVAASRRGEESTGRRLFDHCQLLPGGVKVVVAPPSPVEMRVPVDILADSLPVLATEAGADVIVDCGRIEGSSLLADVSDGSQGARAMATPIARLLGRADHLVLLTRRELSDLRHVTFWLPVLNSLDTPISLVLVGPGPFPAAEISRQFDMEVVGELPVDLTGARLAAGVGTRRGAARLPLVRAVRSLCDSLTSQVPLLWVRDHGAPTDDSDVATAAIAHGRLP